MLKFIFYLMLTLSFVPRGQQCVDGYIQEITLYEGFAGLTGNIFTFRSNIPSLSTYSLPRITEVCVRGVWNLYHEEYYRNWATTFQSEDGNVTCFLTSSSYSFQSLRRGGSSETNKDAISLYRYDYFEDKETLVTNSLAYLPDNEAKSLIVTGNSGWTIFEGQNFTGNSHCVGIDNTNRKVMSVSNVRNYYGIDQIGSLKKGCQAPIAVIVITVIIVLLIVGCIVWRIFALRQKRSRKLFRQMKVREDYGRELEFMNK